MKYLLHILSLLLIFSGCSSPSAGKEETETKKDSTVVVDTAPLPEQTFAKENDTLTGIKFKVDDVIQNKKALETFPATDAISNFIGKKITFSPDTDKGKLVPINGNGLVNTVYLCYAQHRPLVLTPDAIWMTIAQGVSTHINKDFKKLESKLFIKNKPKEIKVRNDSLEYGAKYWQQLIGSLSDSTRKYTQKEMYAFFAPQFSTTTQTIYTAYEANILYAYKKAFTYVGMSGCGIPYITITGTKEDWVKIKEKLILLDELGLGYWREELEIVLDEFIAVFDNQRNEIFWKNILKEYSDYGEFAISGWIIKFFPYINDLEGGEYDEETGMTKMENTFTKNEFLEGDKYLYSSLELDDFPAYKSEATIVYYNFFKDETTHMFLYSGIMAAKQYEDGSLKPWVTWAICSEKEPKAKELRTTYQDLRHRDPDWMPAIFKNDSFLTEKAIYPKRKGITHTESILEFQKELVEFLGTNKSFVNDTLTFYILANGKMMFIADNQKQELKIQNWIDKKGIQWIPAKMKLGALNWMMDKPMDKNRLVPVNCKIEIGMKSK